MDDSWTSRLVGLRVESVEQWEGCPCVVRFAGGYRLHIESLWRLLSSGNLTLTSEDDGQIFGRSKPVNAIDELSATLLGQTLESLQVTQGTADLALHFQNHVLQVISNSSGFEAWQLDASTGVVAIGQGGGSIVVVE